MKITKTTAMLVMLSILSGCMLTDDGQNKLKEAYQKNDKKAIFSLYLQKAKDGDASAQASVGQLYLLGRGVDDDKEKALKWFQLSAEQGNLYAQAKVGDFYYTGDTIPSIKQDYAEALRLLRAPSDAGYETAQRTLGKMYAYGHGVPKDIIKGYILVKMGRGKKPTYEVDWGLAALEEVSGLMTEKELTDGNREFVTEKLSKKVARVSNRYFNDTMTWNASLPHQTSEFTYLQKLPSERDAEVINWVERNSDFVPPIFILEMSRRIFDFDKVKALEWAHVANFRSMYDASRCRDKSARQGALYIRRTAIDVFTYGKDNPEVWRKAAQIALKRDDLFTENVSPLWICSHGVRSYGTEWLVPMGEWDTIKGKLEDDFRERTFKQSN